MKITERRSADTVVLSIDGELTTGGGPLMVLAETVRTLLQQGAEIIVLDLQNVSYVDSFGLGELAEANAVAHNRGGILRLPPICWC